jgi:hypothetical protein
LNFKLYIVVLLFGVNEKEESNSLTWGHADLIYLAAIPSSRLQQFPLFLFFMQTMQTSFTTKRRAFEKKAF